jgi:predicted transcriptional regulator
VPLKKDLQAILAYDYKGPRVAYGEVDVLKALLAIGRSDTNLGRARLGQLTGLGQGEVRTLISRLKSAGLITVDSKGCALTERGKKEFSNISKALPYSGEVEAKTLSTAGYSWAIVVRGNSSKKIRGGIEQRDASIRVGAEGALTVVYTSGRFRIPFAEDKSKADCEAAGVLEPWSTIREQGKPKNGDVVIVSWGSNAMLAEVGALAAALTIL